MKINLHASDTAPASRLDQALIGLELETIHYRKTKKGWKFLYRAMQMVIELVNEGVN